jgi:hypothetical protein
MPQWLTTDRRLVLHPHGGSDNRRGRAHLLHGAEVVSKNKVLNETNKRAISVVNPESMSAVGKAFAATLTDINMVRNLRVIVIVTFISDP